MRMAYYGGKGALSQAMAAEIPLHCNICPKKPDFSDVSHLLTHVASKGHLSNYYKMKVRGSSDLTAKKAVDDYDTWYEEWDVQDLMGERMKQKERKKGGHASASAPRKSKSGSARSTPTLSANSHTSGYRGSRLRESMLDPNLDRPIKIESPSRPTTPIFFRPFDRSAMRGPYAPMMHTWGDIQYDQRMDDGSTVSSESGPFELAYHPTRRSRHYISNSIDSLLNDEEPEEMETITDAARLKGVYWKGMACFDSATPDMKRKRNQKKSHSVVEQLMATSEIIEPIEMVFDANGALRKERTITGNPDNEEDDSPLSGESSPPPEEQPAKKKKKAVARPPRRALAERNPNSGRVINRGNGQLPSYGPSRRSKGTTSFVGLDNDDDLTFGDSRSRKRNGLSIHRDDTGPDITFDTPPSGYTTYGNQMRNQLQVAELQDFGFSGLPHTMDEAPNYSMPQHSFSTGNYHHSHTHQRVPSYGLTSSFHGTFRPANIHPSTHGYASFGQLSNHSFFHPGNMVPHMSILGPALGFGPQTMANDLGCPAQSDFQSWENLLSNTHNVLSNNMTPNAAVVETDTSNVLSGEIAATDGIFASDIQANPQEAEQDDQATISGPGSDHASQ